MKILLVGADEGVVDRWKNTDIKVQMQSMYGEHVDVEFVTQEDCEKIKGEEYNFVIFNETLGGAYQEKPVKSKKRPQKPYYRAKERY
jgi:hypothetical protein